MLIDLYSHLGRSGGVGDVAAALAGLVAALTAFGGAAVLLEAGTTNATNTIAPSSATITNIAF
jgi:hypothetical protein